MTDLKARIAEDYDRTAAGYANHAEPLVFRHLARPLVDALAHLDGPVLDVASGTGALGRRLRDVVAVDLSPGQLRHNPLPRRVLGDAEQLPFRDDAYVAAGCAFGVNHWPRPAAGVAEMARVAPLVGLLTWQRPEQPYAPKQVVLDALAEHTGRNRTDAAVEVDGMTDAVGSEAAVADLLRGAGLDPDVRTVAVEVPWPGPAAFVDYRLAVLGVTALLDDLDGFRGDVIARLDALPAEARRWQPQLVLGLGRRSPL